MLVVKREPANVYGTGADVDAKGHPVAPAAGVYYDVGGVLAVYVFISTASMYTYVNKSSEQVITKIEPFHHIMSH